LNKLLIEILPDELTTQEFDELVAFSRQIEVEHANRAQTLAESLGAALYTRVDAENKTVYLKGMHVVNRTGFEIVIRLVREKDLYNIVKFWPAAAKYITIKGLLRAYSEGKSNPTLNDWEFEAQQCEKVEAAVGRKDPNRFPTCDCGSQRFLVAPQILVNFTVPFVHSGRVTMLGFVPGQKLCEKTVKCVGCHKTFKRSG